MRSHIPYTNILIDYHTRSQIWDIRSKMLIQHYAENAGTLRSICFHPSGNFLLSTCDDATLKVSIEFANDYEYKNT